MIVGTAGHIDHGKTTLVRALTGVDTDRLPEEKKRGISIELGYAYLDVPGSDERLGFIDVPGHERLVRTMLAGSTGIDFALLLVAADDGVRPQTREHLAVLALLGVTQGAVAVTKSDRATPERLAEVCREAEALLQGTPLAGSPLVPVSAQTGDGVAALRERLFEAARAHARAEPPGLGFRLAVDRAFSLSGVGTVMTGTIHAGRVRIGDELVLVPGPNGAGVHDAALRVRSLHAQNAVVEQAAGGQRCAVAVAGLAKDDVSRGQWLVDGAIARSTARMDVRLLLWQGEAKGLRSGTAVHVHVGAASVLGTVAILEGPDPMAPGQEALVQLVLREPVGAWRGDRVVLRDNAATRTLAGGVVLDPVAPARYRRTSQRLAELASTLLPSPAERLQARLAAAPQGIALDEWRRSEGLLPQAMPELPEGAVIAQDKLTGALALGRSHVDALSDTVLERLAEFHAREPDTLGPEAHRLRRLAAPRLPEPLWRALLSHLQSSGRVAVRGAFVHLPAHGVRLSAVDERLGQKIAPLLEQAGYEGAWARDLARDTGESEPLMRTTLTRLAQRGDVHQVVKDLYYPAATITRLAALVRSCVTGVVAASDAGHGAAAPAVTAAAFRDATGLGRKRAIQLLEYFDRVGLLRRVGDEHRLRADSDL